MRVATAAIAPFTLPDSDPPAGFSVDLWTEIARRIGIEFVWRRLPADSELLGAVQRGEADVAIAAITMTPEREAQVDFSHPYFDSGLQILVRAGSKGTFLDTLRGIPWLTMLQFFAASALLVLLLAHVLWLIERRRDDAFAKPYLRAIGEGMWLTLLIIATGEHGERSIPGVVRRVAIVGLWLVGVVLTAHLTATVTSSQTAQRLQSSVNGPADLPGKAIATVPGSTAAEYLTQRALDFVPIQHTTEGIRMLTAGEVQAVVFDAPTLQYWASRQGGGVQVVGSIFRPEKYGIAVANGSPLRKRINEALLAMFADGAYERLYANWFTRAR